ncbi:MAG: DUF4860 domain-containing protein [Lachnospiraceae bacterium]
MQNQKSKGQTMNVLFTMLLFLVFVLCALFTVLIGGKVYENISSRMENNYAGSVSLNYIANKVRQGDEAGQILVRQIDGTDVLELGQDIDGVEFVTWIYCRDGYICELFTDTKSGLGLADGLEIIECDGLNLAMDRRILTVETTGEGGSKLLLSVRSGGL